jgi:hypothetical protein
MPRRRRGVSFWQGGTDRDARFIPKPPPKPKSPGLLDTWPPAYREMIARWLVETRRAQPDRKLVKLVPQTERRIAEAGRPTGVPARLNAEHIRALLALQPRLGAVDPLVRKSDTPKADALLRELKRRRAARARRHDAKRRPRSQSRQARSPGRRGERNQPKSPRPR